MSGNKQFGIHTTGHATLRLAGGNKVTGNGSTLVNYPGIIVTQNSQATIQNNSVAVDSISTNNGPGISVGNNSMLFMVDGSISKNKGDGIQLFDNSTGAFQSTISITSNAGWGLICGDSSKYSETLGTISGNTSGQIMCSPY